jgi:diguanylate cyclase (GGDEF)-like protein/PAS domain S-box-containing protein
MGSDLVSSRPGSIGPGARIGRFRATTPPDGPGPGGPAAGVERPESGTPSSKGVSPLVLAYIVGPMALVMWQVMRHYDVVADVPVWLFAGGLGISALMSKLVERWDDAPVGSVRFHVRIVVHVVSVTGAVYLSGWGPALGMAFAFSAFFDLQQVGANAWRAVIGWSIAGYVVGQVLVFGGWAPSVLGRAASQTIGFLGAFMFVMTIRMAGAIGERKEQADALLAGQTARATRAVEDAQRSEAHYRAVVENAAEGILTIGSDGAISSFNTAAEVMFGWTAAEIIGQRATTIVPDDLRLHLDAFLAAARADGQTAVQRDGIESTGLRYDRSTFPMMVSLSTISVDGAATTISGPTLSGIVRDLSDQKRFEAQLAHQVAHDSLTGLPNRMMLTDRLDQATARIRRHGRMFATLFIDLDRFKSVNDTLGHTAGDQLLVEAAARINRAVRETDTVARLGGDEFVVLCEDLDGLHQATECAERIIAALRSPFHLQDGDAHLSASIGIAVCTEGTNTSDVILANADIAMYRAKNSGRNCYALFDNEMQQWVTAELALEAALREAVPRGELRLFCQPFIEAETGAVRGFEALVRWERPGFGLVMPDTFIPAAEETGLIVDSGAWVIEEACRHAATWEQRWPEQRLGISVNLSSRQLLNGDIVDVVSGALSRTGLEAGRLTLELTESTLVDDAKSAEVLLRRLRALGLNLALDDFGTGYSSLTYLRMFPIGILKIDKSFVRSIGTEREDAAIVAAIVALARNLHMNVVAEGVETHEQLAVLRQLGCPYMQGYLFSRPRPIAEAPAMIDTSLGSPDPYRARLAGS